jgi:hypothetical protein
MAESNGIQRIQSKNNLWQLSGQQDNEQSKGW